MEGKRIVSASPTSYYERPDLHRERSHYKASFERLLSMGQRDALMAMARSLKN